MLPSEVIAAYQPVIGLEVHVQLMTESKIFATEGFAFGSPPNSHVSVITMAHPGSLPSINQQSIAHAIRLGLAMNCRINRETYFARKNYFYPDLPKGYQMSQDQQPICEEGFLELRLEDGSFKRIEIERIHLEEDAGKLVHDQDSLHSLVDLNRSGVGLVEVVTRPDLRSPEEAAALMAEMRKIVRYLGISDGNMQEGSLRCDANVSVMRKSAAEYGTRVEIKNMNSFTHVSDAVHFEIKRQIEQLEEGIPIRQQTRTWDADAICTRVMRDKETADDYRYFPEPDLLPLHITETELDAIKASQPRLPAERFREYTETLQISSNEALVLVEQKEFSDYFDQLHPLTPDPRAASNWLLGPVKGHLNENGLSIEDFAVSAKTLSKLIGLVAEKKVNHGVAKDKILPALIADPQLDPLAVARKMDLLMESRSMDVEAAMDVLIERFPDEKARYLSGKKGLLGFFVGQIMKQFKGKLNPKEVNAVVKQKLEG